MDINVILTAYFAVGAVIILIWCLLFGFLRGTLRSSVRLGTVLLAMGLAAITLAILKNTALASFGQLIQEALENGMADASSDLSDLTAASGDMALYIAELGAALVAPVVFTAAFALFSFITFFVYLIIRCFLPKKKEGEKLTKGSRFGGAGVAFVTAFITIICMMMPAAGYCSFISEEYPALIELASAESATDGTADSTTEENASAEPLISAEVAEILDSVGNNGMVKFINACGGKLIFNATSKIDGVPATEELTVMIDCIGEILPALDQLAEDNRHATEAEENAGYQALNLSALREGILPALEKTSPRLLRIMADVFSAGAERWAAGEAFLGVNISNMLGEEISASVGILMEDLAETNEDEVITDVYDFSVVVEDLSLCLSHFKQISVDNPRELVSKGKKVMDLHAIREDILPLVDQSDIEKRFMADVMRHAAGAWKQGRYFLDINIKDLLGNYQNSADALLARLEVTTAETVVEDLYTVSLDMELLSQTYVYFVQMRDATISSGQLNENLTNIVSNMTPEAVEIIKDSLSQEIVNTVNLKEGTDKAVDLVGDAFENITELPVEEREREAEVMNKVLTYADGDRQDEVAGADVVDALLESSAMSKTVVDAVNKNNDPATAEEDKTTITIDATQKADLDATIDERLTDETLTEDQKEMLNSLKQLFVTE